MGGQEGDIGTIKTADGEFVVENTIHLAGTKIGHVGYVSQGMIKVGDTVSMEVDKENRNLSARNHSATHLLQAALRQVLGTHVEQAGSYVDAERLRFDFTHFSALSKEELKQVENIVNEKIAECLRHGQHHRISHQTEPVLLSFLLPRLEGSLSQLRGHL